MARREFSREELFALVWERPTSGIAKELGISDVALAKLCRRLQVPKPPPGSCPGRSGCRGSKLATQVPAFQLGTLFFHLRSLVVT